MKRAANIIGIVLLFVLVGFCVVFLTSSPKPAEEPEPVAATLSAAGDRAAGMDTVDTAAVTAAPLLKAEFPADSGASMPGVIIENTGVPLPEPAAEAAEPIVPLDEVEAAPSLQYLGSMYICGYDICVECCGKTDGITASGTVATVGRTIAAPPKHPLWHGAVYRRAWREGRRRSRRLPGLRAGRAL